MIRKRAGQGRARRRTKFKKFKKTTDLFKRVNRVVFVDIFLLPISEVFVLREAILPFVGARRNIRAGTCNIKIYRIVCRILGSRWNIAVRDIRRFLRAGDSGF